MQPDDPFHGLEEWARSTERRARRGHAWRRLRALPRRVLRRRVGRISRRTVAVVVLLAVLAGAALLNRDRLLNNGATAHAYPTQSHPSGVYATSTATGPAKGPFEDTPAATYPEGEAALTLPAPGDVDGFSSEQVAASLEQVRRALVAGRLDRRMLVDHDPAAFLALLGPNAAASWRSRFNEGTAISVASQLAPQARLLADPPRVSGRTTYLAAKSETGQRYLEVVTNYVWVYPLEGPDYRPHGRLLLVHDEVHWRFYHPDDVRPADRGMWIGQGQSYLLNADCEQLAKGLLALDSGSTQPTLTRPTATPSVSRPEEYYDPNHSLDTGHSCAE